MGYECQECEVYYEEKPTHITQCKLCTNRLVFVESNINNFKVIDKDLTEDNSRCMACGCRFIKSDYVFEFREAHQNSEFSKSRLVHTYPCYSSDFNQEERQKYPLKDDKKILYKKWIENGAFSEVKEK